MALDATQKRELGFGTEVKTYTMALHKEGIAHTDLRPAGKIIIDGKVYDATSSFGYIEKGNAIEVIAYENAQLIVKKK